MRIRQAYISPCLKHFEDRFRTKYGLIEDYHSRNSPIVFFGCYTSRTAKLALNHNSDVIIVWAGSDAKGLYQYLNRLKRDRIRTDAYRNLALRRNVHHIAISKWIERDLLLCGFKFQSEPITPTSVEFCCTETPKLGDCLYSYGLEEKPEVYNARATRKVLKCLPGIELVNLNLGDGTHSYKDMWKIYQKCFLGLRLTEHDGLPNSVVELGLMGRKCVFNGTTPNALLWSDINDVVETIREERMREDSLKRRKKISKDMKEFLNVSDDWLNTRFYL